MEFEVNDELLDDHSLVIKVSGSAGSTGIMLSTLWNQSGVARVGNNTTVRYNEYCPYISGSSTHSVTGCTNTAAGQIIYYFIEKGLLEFRLTLTASDVYTDDNGLQVKADGSTPGTVSFSVINSKLADYDLNSADDAAALVYACGVVQQADYGSSTSTAWNLDLFYRSGFECVNQAQFYRRTDAFWGSEGAISDAGFEVLIENLTAGRVVGTSYPGHALVIDGYDSKTDQFHINFGWGDSKSTRWYTREEINAQGYYHFIYDLMPEGEEVFTVSDSRLYGTGTFFRALELAEGTKGANTINFDKSVAGEKLVFDMRSWLSDEVTFNNFNMEMISYSSDYAYGFSAVSGAVGIFKEFSGALIANAEKYNYAFMFNNGSRLELDTDHAVIYAGAYTAGGSLAGGEAVLGSLRASQSSGGALEEFILDSSQVGYSVSATGGNDTIVFDNETIVVGNISLGAGDDTLTVTGGSRVYGDISPGDGNDVITIDSTSSVTGDLFGALSLNLLLTAEPDDEAMFCVADYMANFLNHASVTADISNASTGKYTLVSVDPAANAATYLDRVEITVDAGNDNTCTLSVRGTSDCKYAELLKEGNSLVLRIKGFDSSDTTPPAVPGSLKAVVTGNSVSLDWSDSTDNKGLEGYLFRYGTSENLSGEGTFTSVSEALISSLANGTYYYQVRAKDISSNLSEWSAVMSFTVNYSPESVTFSSGGLFISGASVMTGKTVSGSGAEMNVSSGGIASQTTVADRGKLQIFRSGLGSSIQVSSGGILSISSGGCASGVQVYSGGSLVLSRTGTARDLTISRGGTIAGFTLDDKVTSFTSVTVNSLKIRNAHVTGKAYIYSGCSAENIDVLSGGTLYISSGGSASVRFNPWSGTVNSYGGAVVRYLERDKKVYYGNKASGIVSSGDLLSALSVSGGKELRVYSGGLVKGGAVLSGGTAYISSGGSAEGMTVSSGGRVLLSGGTLNGAQISGGVSVLAQGVLKSSFLHAGGSACVSSGGSAAEVSVAGGVMTVSKGGNAESLHLLSGGSLYIVSGGSVSSVTLTGPEGRINISSGAVVSDITMRNNASVYVSQGVEIGSLRLDHGSASLYGRVESAVAGSRSYLSFSSEDAGFGEVSVTSAGRLYFSDAVINGSISMERGSVLILKSSCSSQKDITVNGTLRTALFEDVTFNMQNHTLTLDLRERFVSDAFLIDDLSNITNAKYSLRVSADQASGVYELARGAGNFTGSITVTDGSLSGTLRTNSKVTLGKSVYSLAVNDSGTMSLTVENTGTNKLPVIADYLPGTWSTDWVQASEYAAETGKYIFAFYSKEPPCTGGMDIEKELFRDPGFYEFAKAHLVLLYDTLPGGQSYESSHAGHLLNADGTSFVSRYDFEPGYTESWMTWLKLHTGQTSGIYTIQGQLVSSMSTASGVLLNTSMYVAGASAGEFKVSSGGRVYVLDKGCVSGAVIDSYGSMHVLRGGQVKSSVVGPHGYMHLSGGTASDVYVSSGGNMFISSGSIVSGLQVDSGTVCIYSGGTASDIRGGGIFMFQCCGGTMVNAEIFSGGYAYVSSGGILSGAVISSGGSCYGFSQSILRGFISNAGFLSADQTGIDASEAVISFDLRQRTTSDSYMVHDMQRFNGAAFTITVADNQARGTYRLAYNPDGYDKTITIGNGTAEFGTLTIGGAVLAYGDYEYNLFYSGKYLSLTVTAAAIPAPTVTADITELTNSDVRLTAVFDGQAVRKEYRIDGGEWQSYTSSVVVDRNCLAEFRCSDSSGVYSRIVSYNVTCIDKTAPLLTLAGETERPVQAALLTAAVDDGSTIMYRTGSADWSRYTGALSVTSNGTWYFKATDAAGNISEKSITFSNISSDAPGEPYVFADITEPTRLNVTVTAVFTPAAAAKQYSLNGTRWYTYSSPITFNSNTTIYFREIDGSGKVSETVSYTVSNIDRSAPNVPGGFEFRNGKVDWQDALDNGIAGVTGYQFRYGSSSTLSGNGEVVSESCFDCSALEAGAWYCQVRSIDAAGNNSGWSQVFSFTVTAGLTALEGNASGVTWQDSSGSSAYKVEYSRDNFEHVIAVELPGCGADTYGVPEGAWQWRADTAEGSGWKEGNSFTAPAPVSPQKYISDADLTADIFFASPRGVWEEGFAAQHLESFEMLLLAGKNKITDIFEGSADANVLILSDDANGDALFVEDIYSAPGYQARLKQIDEIRAGAGDDMVDMTSRRFVPQAKTLLVRGGEGDDVIWGGKNSNILFGDAGADRLSGGTGDDILSGGAGNDTLRGGGGSDIFTFGADWGSDTVEQSSSGSVTLWFESGSESNWDAESFTYTDGANSVTVTGCVSVTLKFGTGALPEGAFEKETSRKVFEESLLAPHAG